MAEIKPPALESLVGMETYYSKTSGIGGFLKKAPEDFLVEEVMEDGTVLSIGQDLGLDLGEKKEYLHFTLEKNNWDTMRAIKAIGKRLRVGPKRFGFAGTKDKKAITTQRVAVWNIESEKLMCVNLRDIVIRDPQYSAERINLGCLSGNRFTITIRDIVDEGAGEKIESIARELSGRAPNFFGLQRFGVTRPITHVVGKRILERDFEGAVMTYLAEVYEEENEESREARKAFRDTGDIKEALKNYPKHLGYEKAMLGHLLHTPTDYIGAMRELPKKLRWMFIHAYQGYVFNKALSAYIEACEIPEKLPLAGYGIDLDRVTAGILEEENVKPEDFKVSEMPEMSSEGLMRDSFFGFEDFSLQSIDEEKAVVSFTLPKGSYATTLMREFMKNSYW